MDDNQIKDVNNIDDNGHADLGVNELETMKTALSECENNWKRALADYKNLQKRFDEERSGIINFANTVLIAKLLPVLDNLEMLNQHLEDTGLKLTLKEFKNVLTEAGVVEIEVIDKEFDARTMDAVDVIEGPENMVMEVLTKGYMLKNSVLRPARVKVGRSALT